MKSSTNKLRAPIAAFGASNRNDTAAASGDELIGVKGQKYGLQVRGGAATSAAPKKAASRAALPIFAAAANEADRDSDTDEKRKRLLAAGDSQKKKVFLRHYHILHDMTSFIQLCSSLSICWCVACERSS